MKYHSVWFKRILNPILRKINLEICSIVSNDKVIGYGIRKKLNSK